MLKHTSPYRFLDKSVASDPSERDQDEPDAPDPLGEAFGESYVRHFHAVRAFIAQRNGHWQSSEDVAQEVFCRAWEAPERFRGESRVRTYFIGIAKNVLNENRREHGALPLRSLERLSPSKHPYCVPADADAPEGVEYRHIIAQAMDELTPLQRQAVELEARGDLPRPEAAALAGCSLNAFASRLSRARRRMRALLKDAGKTG